MNRSRRNLVFRIVFVGMFAVLSFQAASVLAAGEPDYLNWFRQPVSAHVALAVGLVGIVLLLVPWPRRSGSGGRGGRSRRQDGPQGVAHESDGAPGRNDPCPCGSGRKYKKCCLRSAEEARRRDRIDRQSAALNRSRGVTGSADMAGRGLRGR